MDFTTGGYEVVTSASGDPRFALQADYRPGVEWPHLILRPRADHWDWSAASTLILPISNRSDHPVELTLRIGDDAAASWPQHALAGTVVLPPRSARTVLFALCPFDPRSMGMRSGPPAGGSEPLAAAARRDGAPVAAVDQAQGRLDRSQVRSIYLVAWSQQYGHRLLLGPPATAGFDWGAANYRGLIDRFGQSTRGEWPGKVHDDAQLRQASSAASGPSAIPRAASSDRGATLATSATAGTSQAGPLALDAYGGLLAGPAFKATGFFHTARAGDGRWWLVTPAGHPFFSVGVDTVATGDGATYVQGRESMFSGLPAPDGALASHYGQSDLRAGLGAQAGRRLDHGRYFNFYTANLQRKYGNDWHDAWITATRARLRAWGFNTLGNWSDPRMREAGQAALGPRLPYTLALSIEGDFARVSDGVDYWGQMADPFDPRFAQAVDRVMSTQAAPHRDDPHLLGYFVDNELAWGNGRSPDPRQRFALAYSTLALSADSPAKQAFIALLRERYHTVAAWRTAWGIAAPQGRQAEGARAEGARAEDTQTGDWRSVAAGSMQPHAPTPAALEDLSHFTRRLADAYYRTVAQALKRHDPNHLYLGSRFAAQTDEAVGACDRWCDVVSFNIYFPDFEAARRDRFGELTKPALVGEFNFSSTDRGPFWPGLVDVGSEDARGPAYAAYVRAAAADPQMVGVHWFQYLDEPASGRLLDGENAHFGLVSITDTPYEGFLEDVRRANVKALTARSAPTAPPMTPPPAR